MTLDEERVRVLVIGAGAAGLSAATRLIEGGVAPSDVLVLEARERAGGRVLTRTMSGKTAEAADAAFRAAAAAAAASPVVNTGSVAGGSKQQVESGAGGTTDSAQEEASRCAMRSKLLPDISVDVGASLMHGCADENQVVFQRALKEKIRAPVVAGGGVYECTEHARWFHHDEEVPTRTVVEMHAVFWIIGRCMAAIASVNDDVTADLLSSFSYAKEYVLSSLGDRKLSDTENRILEKIAVRSFGYCSPLSKMALLQAAISADPDDDAIVGPYADRDADFGLPSASALLEPRNLTGNVTVLKRRIANADYPSVGCISRRNLAGDRIVIDGYTPFLIDKMKEGLNIRYHTVVDRVSYREGSSHPTKRLRSQSTSSPAPIQVHTRGGLEYSADYAVVTLPLGVLQGLSNESSVTFDPALSEEKQVAINSLGMGVHNKVVLRFHPDDVFWPSGTPQLNCLDPRFQFFNLHAYGKAGVLLAHVFGGTDFASGYRDLDDGEVVQEVLTVLESMFISSAQGSSQSCKQNTTLQLGLGDKMAPLSEIGESKVETSRDPVADDVVEDEGELEGGVDGRVEEDVSPPGTLATSDSSFMPSEVIPGGKTSADFEEVVEDEGDRTYANKDMPTSGKSGDRENCSRVKQRQRSLRIARAKGGEASPAYRKKKSEARPCPTRIRRSEIPRPLETIVTRWDKDPFCMGSYSFLPVGADWDMIAQIAYPEPHGAAVPTLFFAGEHCNDLGWQCVHGACESGIDAANEILAHLFTAPSENEPSPELMPRDEEGATSEVETMSITKVDKPGVRRSRGVTNQRNKRILGENGSKISSVSPPVRTALRNVVAIETIRQLEEYWDAPAFKNDVLDVIAATISHTVGREVSLASVSRIVNSQAARDVSCAKNFLQYHKSGRGASYTASSKMLYGRTVRTSKFRWTAHEDLTLEALRVGYGLVRKALAHHRVLHEYTVWQCIGEHLHKISGYVVGIRALRSRVELQSSGRCRTKLPKLSRLSENLVAGFKKLSCANPSSAMESRDFKFPLEGLDDEPLDDETVDENHVQAEKYMQVEDASSHPGVHVLDLNDPVAILSDSVTPLRQNTEVTDVTVDNDSADMVALDSRREPCAPSTQGDVVAMFRQERRQ